MSDLDRLMAQVEELKKLATRPDDSWMQSMSTEELQSLGRRVRRVADGLSGLQSQIRRSAPGAASAPMPPPMPRRTASSGSLGSMVRSDTSSRAAAPSPPPSETAKPSYNPFREAMASKGLDMSNPLQRRNRPNI